MDHLFLSYNVFLEINLYARLHGVSVSHVISVQMRMQPTHVTNPKKNVALDLNSLSLWASAVNISDFTEHIRWTLFSLRSLQGEAEGAVASPLDLLLLLPTASRQHIM